MKAHSAVNRLIFAPPFMVCLLLTLSVCSLAQGNAWTSIHSQNFFLVGNATEQDMRQVASELERFRAIFSQLLTEDYFRSSTPTTVIVFQHESEYKPFQPLYKGQPADVAGYFLSSPEMNYITLTVEKRQGKDLSSVVFHEYVHLLVKNKFRRAPLWFKEGLSEYYSTFDLLKGNKKIRLAKRLNHRIHYLRGHNLLPLTTLLAVDHQSPYYNEHDKRGIFYAQSWALVHYLMSGNGGARQPQLWRYLELLATDVPDEDAFRQAFQTDIPTLENELRKYIRLARYPEQVKILGKSPEFNLQMQLAPLREAAAQAHLGDLLLRTGRPDVAENYLQRAITLDPNFAPARIWLSILYLRDNRLTEAKEHLQHAIATDPQNYLARYHFADVLRREGTEAEKTVKGYEETTRAIRAELKKAIELAPNFLDAYGLLAVVDLERNPQLDEATALLKQALALAPKRQEFTILLAQIHLRKEEFNAARQLLEGLVQSDNSDAQLRAQVQAVLDTVASKEELAAQRRARSDGMLVEAGPEAVPQPCDLPEPGPQHKRLRFAGEQVCGQLVSVECAETGVMLFVEVGDRTLKLRSAALNRIRFVTYTAEVKGRIECGLRNRANPVLVTYRSAQGGNTKVDGDVLAVEFIPLDWKP